MNLKSQNNIFALDEISNAMFTCEMRGSSVDAAPKQNCKRFLRFSVKSLHLLLTLPQKQHQLSKVEKKGSLCVSCF